MFTTEWKFGILDFEEVRAIRILVFMQELGQPEEEAFDWEDGIAAHLLVRLEDGTAVATARIYPDGGNTRIDSFAVLPQYRKQGYGDVCLRLLLYKAQQLPGECVVAKVPEQYEAYYAWFGFQPEEDVPGRAGKIPMKLSRDKIRFPSECGQNH